MDFLMLPAGFTFGDLSKWTFYDLKEQFSKLAPWNMHWPTVHLLQQRFVLVPSNKYEQRTQGNSLGVRTLTERLSVNNILR